MKSTYHVAQTLTCNIGDVDNAVEVSWQDKDNKLLTNGQGGYSISQGSVSKDKHQISTLTITADTLKDLDRESTWKCAARSTEYPDSEQSPFQDLEVIFLTLGKSLLTYIICLVWKRIISLKRI